MMPGDYLPAGLLALKNWNDNFKSKITATPTAYGLVAGDATAFGTVADDYAAKLAVSTTPATRTKVTVEATQVAKRIVKAKARELVAKVQAYPPLTDPQKAELGITIRDTGNTPTPAPATRPLIQIVGTSAGEFELRLSDELTPDSRRRPTGVIGANVYMKVGGPTPTTVTECVHIGMLSRSPIIANISSAPVGTLVYLIARWQNRRGQMGPQSLVASQVRAA